MAVGLNLIRDLRILLENILKQKLLGKSKCLDRLVTHVYKLGPHVINHKMVTNNEHLCKLLDSSKLILGIELALKEVAHGHQAFKTEVHFGDLILFIIDDLVVWIDLGVEVSWQEPIAHIVEELLLPT